MKKDKKLILTSLKVTENDVKKLVKDYLKLKGWFHFHIMQGMGSYSGSPDRIAIKDGRVLFLEIKKPKGWKHSDAQKAFQANIENQKGEYYLIRSLEELIKIIEKGGKYGY